MMKINFEKYADGLVPTVVQDDQTRRVLMLGFMNEAALEKTMQEGKVTFYSRSRQALWTKGETSGNFLFVVEVLNDCDQDTLLIKARPAGPVCHTGADTCFNENNQEFTLEKLEQVIRDRQVNPSNKSYTTSLLNSGINKIAQKLGEEAVELVIESKDDDSEKFLNESADLLFHFLVLLRAKDKQLVDVIKVLDARHK